MQEQKINSTLYLALQSSYEEIQVALFNKDKLLSKKNINKIEASRNLINTVSLILKENKFSIEDLTFVAVNIGPGPFTTLRVVIATTNALNFAGNLPLIEVSGIEAYVDEFQEQKYEITIALLNAFNNDIYFAIKENNTSVKIGWQNINKFLEFVQNKYSNKKIKFIGNGAILFKNEINKTFNDFAFFPENIPTFVSIEKIAQKALENWSSKKNIVDQATPLYLKEAVKS